MLAAVPVVHRREPVERVADRELRTFGKDVQRLVGNRRRDLEDRVGDRVQSGHLQIDPDQMVFVDGRFGHGRALSKGPAQDITTLEARTVCANSLLIS